MEQNEIDRILELIEQKEKEFTELLKNVIIEIDRIQNKGDNDEYKS